MALPRQLWNKNPVPGCPPTRWMLFGVLSILAALLFPVFARARENARGSSCSSNLKQIGLAISMYTADYDGACPMNRMPDADHHLTGCVPTPSGNPSDGLEGSSINWK